MVLPRTEPPQAARMRSAIALAPLVDLDHASRRCERRAGLLGVRTSASVSLGKQLPPIARAGMQELAADAAVQPDAARDFLDVGADLLAQVGDLVDEGDLGREEAVGRVLDQLRGLQRGEQDRRLRSGRAAGRALEHLGARALSMPTTTRSGRMKSSIAEPSRRNSGLEATSNRQSGRAARSSAATLRPVPTGTVDLVTTTV